MPDLSITNLQSISRLTLFVVVGVIFVIVVDDVVVVVVEIEDNAETRFCSSRIRSSTSSRLDVNCLPDVGVLVFDVVERVLLVSFDFLSLLLLLSLTGVKIFGEQLPTRPLNSHFQTSVRRLSSTITTSPLKK